VAIASIHEIFFSLSYIFLRPCTGNNNKNSNTFERFLTVTFQQPIVKRRDNNTYTHLLEYAYTRTRAHTLFGPTLDNFLSLQNSRTHTHTHTHSLSSFFPRNWNEFLPVPKPKAELQ
jgi:hypothetical protein